jgi:hypothetical protein
LEVPREAQRGPEAPWELKKQIQYLKVVGMSLKPLKPDQKHFWRCPNGPIERPRSSLGAKTANLILKNSRNDPKIY